MKTEAGYCILKKKDEECNPNTILAKSISIIFQLDTLLYVMFLSAYLFPPHSFFFTALTTVTEQFSIFFLYTTRHTHTHTHSTLPRFPD